MDRLSERLLAEANRIDASIAPELEARINASLRAVTPVRAVTQNRPTGRWRYLLAGGVTVGVAAVAVVVAMLADNPETARPISAAGEPEVQTSVLPQFDIEAEAAALTSPLVQEFEALQADLQKVEKKLRGDVGL